MLASPVQHRAAVMKSQWLIAIVQCAPLLLTLAGHDEMTGPAEQALFMMSRSGHTFGAGGEADGLRAQHDLAAAADGLPEPEHHAGPTVLHAHLQAAAPGLAPAARRTPGGLQPSILISFSGYW